MSIEDMTTKFNAERSSLSNDIDNLKKRNIEFDE